MKSLIVTIAILPILMFFPLQNTVQNINHYRTTSFNNIAYKHIQIARVEGHFSDENIEELLDTIEEVFFIDRDDMIVNVTTEVMYRGEEFVETEVIEYEIGLPIDKFIAMHRFFNVEDEDNKGYYVLRGSVQSERLEMED